MSARLTRASDDLRRLADDGYQVRVVAGQLLLERVPYLTSAKQVCYGTLVSELTLNGDVTAQPSTHVAYFAGDTPCDIDGARLRGVLSGQPPHAVTPELVAQHTMSCPPLPDRKYKDYYDKMTAYVAILGTPVATVDPAATARTYQPVVDDDPDSVFRYVDTAAGWAGTAIATSKLQVDRVAIVGAGGTASYLLDFLAKTPVREVHVFDGDRYFTHNAFRCPGAPTIEQLHGAPMKVDYLHDLFSPMREGIFPHPYYLTVDNVDELAAMSFVFVCIDKPQAKRPIIDYLNAHAIPFVDAGMGLDETDGRIGGLVRTTLVNDSAAQRVGACEHISLGAAAADGADEYATNIQIAELNALNAVMAISAWKKHAGFYNDVRGAELAVYVVDSNTMINDTVHE